MGFRIGRVGLATFDGNAENEFMTIKAFGISCYYLLLALRSVSVLRQLPFRETARPRTKKNDIDRVLIPNNWGIL